MRDTLKKLHIGDTNHTGIQFYRYLFVGGSAFVVDFALLYIFTHFAGLHYVLSASLSFFVGCVFNYVLSTKWIFALRTIKNKNAEFWFFVGIGVTGLILNALIILFFTDLIGFHYLVSKIISTALVFSWNFGARKYFLFS